MENTNNELRELLNRALETLQMTIEELDKLKPKQPFTEGDVVKYGDCIVKITNYELSEGYGLNTLEEWVIQSWSFKTHPELWQLSTPEKWLEVCKNEAVKRGLVEGAKVNLSPVNPKFREKVKLMRNNYSLIQCGLSVDNLIIMQNGIWVEVIKPDVTLEILFEGWLNSEAYVNHIKDNLEQFDKAIKNLQNQK